MDRDALEGVAVRSTDDRSALTVRRCAITAARGCAEAVAAGGNGPDCDEVEASAATAGWMVAAVRWHVMHVTRCACRTASLAERITWLIVSIDGGGGGGGGSSLA